MRTRFLPSALLLGAITACGGGGDGGGGPNPTPGQLDVVLVSATTAPGAIMMTISGGQIDGVTAAGYVTYQSATTSNSRKVLLTGNIVAGTVLKISVPDINKANNYVVSVLQVAARASAPVPYAQLPVAGYPVDVQ